jgi:hypothetical protein
MFAGLKLIEYAEAVHVMALPQPRTYLSLAPSVEARRLLGSAHPHALLLNRAISARQRPRSETNALARTLPADASQRGGGQTQDSDFHNIVMTSRRLLSTAGSRELTQGNLQAVDATAIAGEMSVLERS